VYISLVTDTNKQNKAMMNDYVGVAETQNGVVIRPKTRERLNQYPDNRSLVGKYVSEFLWSDVKIVGRIIDHFGQTGIIVQPMEANPNPNFKLDVTPGGFAGHVNNQHEQEWLFEDNETEEPIRFRVNLSFFKWYGITDEPYHYYDFNF